MTKPHTLIICSSHNNRGMLTNPAMGLKVQRHSNFLFGSWGIVF